MLTSVFQTGFIRGGRPIRLGQLPDVGVQTGTTLECYKCGLNPPRQMTAAMAALVPGGCTKVDASECAVTDTGTGTTGQNTWTPGNTGAGTNPISGGGLAVGMGAGNLDVKFSVFRADKAYAVTGVRVASKVVLTETGQVVSTMPDQVTGNNGFYLIHAASPAPKRSYTLKIVVSPEPGGMAFDPVHVSIPMLQNNDVLQSSELVTIGRGVVICPKGAIPLVCEVGRKQLLYKSVLAQQMAAWDVRSGIASGFVSDAAHAALEETPVEDPMLAKYWIGEMSYIVADLRIPPSDFPELLENYDQMKRIWNEIPWPGDGTLKGLFQRCAAGVVLQDDQKVFQGGLYAKTRSSFFPKEDAQIRKVLATRFLENLINIYKCMEHKIERKAANLERQQKKWAIIGMVISLVVIGGGDSLKVIAALAQAGIAMSSFNTAMDFSRFMMGYNDFIEQCVSAGAKDFTCEYMAPFILWCMEAIFFADFLDYVAIEAGLPGARKGLTREEVIDPMVQSLKDSGVDVPIAAQTPGGVAPSTGKTLAAVAGIGGISAIALLLFGAFRR